jgi:hypothetical protein
MKRGFWLSAGLAAGATGAVLASRFVKKQAKRMAPTSVAKEMQHELFDISKRVAGSIAEGKAAMEEREAEIRAEIEGRSSGSAPLD